MKKFNISSDTIVGLLVLGPIVILLWVICLSFTWMIISNFFNF